MLAEPFIYSTSSAAECESPKPALTVMYGSTSMSLHRVMNSSEAKIVGLHRIPRIIKFGGRLSMSPTMWYQLQSGGEVAAIAPEAHRDLAQKRNRVRPESLDIVRRHEGNRTDVEAPAAGSGDFE